jgi:hypothetical protein
MLVGKRKQTIFKKRWFDITNSMHTRLCDRAIKNIIGTTGRNSGQYEEETTQGKIGSKYRGRNNEVTQVKWNKTGRRTRNLVILHKAK